MEQPKIIGICEICKAPIYETQKYRKLPLRKDKYVHTQCEQMRRARMFAIGAWVRT
jgi:hypothetical protein